MSDSNSELGYALVVLIVLVAGYQAITHFGNYLAEEIFRIPEVEFWVLTSFFLGAFATFVLGVSISKILKGG